MAWVQASVPYFEMLEQWVYHGHLDDPYREFMVREEDGLQKENVVSDFNATYWDSRWVGARLGETTEPISRWGGVEENSRQG